MTTRVAFDATPRVRPGGDRGLGRYSAWWLDAWDRLDDFTVVPLDYKTSSARLANILEMPGRERALARARADVLHVTTPLHLALTKRQRWITSVQDIVALDDPRYRQTGMKNKYAVRQLQRSDLVVTSASFTAGRIQAYADVSSERIRVLPLPVHDSFFATVPRNLSAAPYALTMADLRTPDPRKRSLWLPAIASRLAGLGVELRVVGPVTSGEIDLPQGSLLGRVSDKELAELMAGAICFISPSQYEGQGLPPVEAMAAGTPVLAFRNSAVAETIGVDDFLIDEPGVGEESAIPGSVLKVMVERVQQFGQERSRYGEMARRRAEAFRPHAFFAGVEQLAKEVRLWSDA